MAVVSSQSSPLLKWVSLKELVFVFTACSVIAVLIQTQDQLELKAVWNDSYILEGASAVPKQWIQPIVVDLNSNGRSDILTISPDNQLNIYNQEISPAYLGHQGLKFTRKNVQLDVTKRVVAMATGYLQSYQSMVQVRKQVIVVLYSDWTVVCLSHVLEELWNVKVTEKPNHITSEPSILISPVNLKNQDNEEDGVVIVGGRVDPNDLSHSSYQRMRQQTDHNQGMDQLYLDSMGHYSTYAIDGGSGGVIWSHEPGDFSIEPAYDDSILSFHHYKLTFDTYSTHKGELSWHQYSSAIKRTLPHSWMNNYDTKMELAHFEKDRKKTDSPPVNEHIKKAGSLAAKHIAGYAFGGLRPHSPSEHVSNPNVLIIRNMKGLEVLHLHGGRPMFTLPLSPSHSSHGDIDSDGMIDHVSAVVHPRPDYTPGDVVNKHEDIVCYGQATTDRHKSLYKHSICKATHWTEAFISTEKWLPNLNTFNRKKINHGITEPVTPLLIESSSHQHPLKISMLKQNFSFKMPLGVVYDAIFLLSSGRVTSIGPSGQFNWQVDTLSDWDYITDKLYSTHQPDHGDLLLYHSFVPTLTGFALKPFDKKSHILIIGWHTLSILNALDGTILVEHPLPHKPITSKPLIADFNDDGTNDIIITTNDRVIGLSLVHKSGFWHSTVLSLFVGFVIVVVAVYTRQRTGFLMPRRKEA